MQVRRSDQTYLDYTRAQAAPTGDVLTSDYYTQLPQILLTPDPAVRSSSPQKPIEVTLDDQDVAKLVACAVKHPVGSMRHAVLAAIWNEPEVFRQIFRFGLEASPVFPEIRKIVAEELDRHQLSGEQRGADSAPAGAGNHALLPRVPLPAHLRRERRE